MTYSDTLKANGFTHQEVSGGSLKVTTPIDGSVIAEVKTHSIVEAEKVITRAAMTGLEQDPIQNAVWLFTRPVSETLRMPKFFRNNGSSELPITTWAPTMDSESIH